MRKLSFIPKAALLALLCALGATLSAQQRQQRRQVVVVLESVGSRNVTDLNKASVGGVLEDFLLQGGKYRVVDRKRANQVFGELHLQRSSVMIDPNTAKQIGKHLRADLVCASELIKEGGYTNINVSLIDVETGVIAGSGTDLVSGDGPAAIRGATMEIASRITGVMTPGQRAALKSLRRTVTYGFYAGAGIPMGEFGGMDVPATPAMPVAQSEGYDPGVTARFTMTFPLFFRYLGLRAGAGFAYNTGANTAYGYKDLGLTYIAFGASGELQIFFDESYRHRGTYIFGGAAINNETFSESDTSFMERKVRLGATAGLGHTFTRPGGRGGWTIELAYHATLSAKDTAAGDKVAADHIRVGVGYVF
jgi:hypothetical protein